MDIELIHPDKGVIACRGAGGGGGLSGTAAGGGRLAAGDRRGRPGGSAVWELRRVRRALVAVGVIALLIAGASYHYCCNRDQ